MSKHFCQTFFAVVIMILVAGLRPVDGYLEISSVLKMLNIPWEGRCPVNPPLQRYPELARLGYLGKCPTVYQVTELVPGTEPRAVLEGFCDPSCHDTVCGSSGDFRCRNFTVPLDVTVPTLVAESSDELEVVKLTKKVYISVGCVCQFRKSFKLHNIIPQTVI